VIVVIVLLFLTVPLSYMPEAVLSSVVFLIGIELVDIKGMRSILAQRPVEFWIALITAAVVIFIGVEQGILLAILLSILLHVRHGYKPKNSLQEIDPTGKPHMVPVSSHAQAIPGLIIYRFHHSMYYANAELFSQEVLELITTADPPISWFCIDATAVDDIDFSAAANLRETYKLMKEKGVRLVLAEVEEDIRLELDRSEVTGVIGKDFIFETVADVEAAYRATLPGNKT
jgi:SulP family sulfate permease